MPSKTVAPRKALAIQTAGFGVLHPIFAQGFMQGVGSKNIFSSATQDCANKFAVADLMYGFPFTQPFPDLERTGTLIIIGANPAVSKWAFLQVPHVLRRLRAIEERGGRVFVVDPRRTETAKAVGEHVFIRPDTDVFLLLSFLRQLLTEHTIDQARVRRFMSGYEALWPLVEPWPAERTAEVTRVAPETLRRMVEAYAHAPGAAIYSSTGVNMGTNGSLAFWLQECINAVSGNLDRAGGTLVGRGIVDFAALGKRAGLFVKRNTSRVGGFSSVNDALPGGILADEILRPGAGQIKALFVTGGNPLITMPNAARLRRALRELELLVVLDIQPSETASIATHVLPCTSPLQRPDLPFAFPLLLGMQLRPYLQATEAVLPIKGAQRDEASIYLDLARAAGLNLWGSKAAQHALQFAQALRTSRHRDQQPAIPQRRLLSLLLRLAGEGSFSRLLKSPHGRARSAHRAGSFLGARVPHDDQRVHLAPDLLLQRAEALDQDFARLRAQADELLLVTRRSLRTHNSWTHNLVDFVAAEGRTNHLYMHPDDAGRLGLTDGALVDVHSATGALRLPLKHSEEMMCGVVALPHGWGHQASGLGVARETQGVNVNLLAPDGPERLERVSGMAQLTGIAVRVGVAAGPLDPKSWSGMDAKAQA